MIVDLCNTTAEVCEIERRAFLPIVDWRKILKVTAAGLGRDVSGGSDRNGNSVQSNTVLAAVFKADQKRFAIRLYRNQVGRLQLNPGSRGQHPRAGWDTKREDAHHGHAQIHRGLWDLDPSMTVEKPVDHNGQHHPGKVRNHPNPVPPPERAGTRIVGRQLDEWDGGPTGESLDLDLVQGSPGQLSVVKPKADRIAAHSGNASDPHIRRTGFSTEDGLVHCEGVRAQVRLVHPAERPRPEAQERPAVPKVLYGRQLRVSRLPGGERTAAFVPLHQPPPCGFVRLRPGVVQGDASLTRPTPRAWSADRKPTRSTRLIRPA